jgi:hypothetical protein
VEDMRSRLGWRSAARASVERARVHNDDGDDVPQRLSYMILRLSSRLPSRIYKRGQYAARRRRISCCKRGGCPAASPTLRAMTRGSCAPAGVGIERAVAGGGGARRRGARTPHREGLPPPGVAVAAPLAGIRSCAAAELVEASVLKGVDLAWARRRHRRCA